MKGEIAPGVVLHHSRWTRNHETLFIYELYVVAQAADITAAFFATAPVVKTWRNKPRIQAIEHMGKWHYNVSASGTMETPR